LIEKLFQLQQNQTTLRQEILGGMTTFLTMAYIVVVNPQILAQAGMPPDGVVFATCLSAAVATLVMGLYANYPIALAPGMSLNAYFTYSVSSECMCRGPWRWARSSFPVSCLCS
jgi:Permeases